MFIRTGSNHVLNIHTLFYVGQIQCDNVAIIIKRKTDECKYLKQFVLDARIGLISGHREYCEILNLQRSSG